MTRRFLIACALLCAASADTLQASSRGIVRVSFGADAINSVCGLVGCNLVRDLGDPLGSLFLVTSDLLSAPLLNSILSSVPGILSTEIDQQAVSADATATIPSALTDITPSFYYGSPVIH